MTIKSPIAVITLVITAISAIYFPIADSNDWFPFKKQMQAPDSSRQIIEVKLEQPVEKKSAELTLQGVDIKDAKGQYPVLDIKILNEGKLTAVLTKVSATIENVWKLTPKTGLIFNALPISATYIVPLKFKGQLPFTIEIPVSQTIDENKADRFTLKLQHDGSGMADHIIKARITLHYNQEKVTEITDLIFIASRPGFSGKYSAPINPEIISIINELKKVDGTKSDNLKELISRIGSLSVN